MPCDMSHYTVISPRPAVSRGCFRRTQDRIRQLAEPEPRQEAAETGQFETQLARGSSAGKVSRAAALGVRGHGQSRC